MSFLAAVAAAQKVARAATSPGDIAYIRGAEEATLTAGRGRTTFENLNASGVLIRIESRDFLIATDELILAGEITLPVRGDKIRETDEAGNTCEYEILELNGEPAWRYSDGYRLQLRVHTKLTS